VPLEPELRISAAFGDVVHQECHQQHDRSAKARWHQGIEVAEGVPLTKGGARPFSVTVEDPPPGTVDVTVSITDMEEWKVSEQQP
jgi:hypothetical protein